MAKKIKSQDVAIEEAVEIPEVKKAPKKPIPEPGATVHTIAEGETLADVATRYGLSLKRLQILNDVTGPVEIGQQLVVEVE